MTDSLVGNSTGPVSSGSSEPGGGTVDERDACSVVEGRNLVGGSNCRVRDGEENCMQLGAKFQKSAAEFETMTAGVGMEGEECVKLTGTIGNRICLST